MFLENGYATMKKHRSVSNRKIPRVHKRKMEEIHDKCDKGGAGSVIKKAAFEKAAGQNYDQRSDDRLRHQPDGVYYHFKDIPDVVEFILKKKWDEILEHPQDRASILECMEEMADLVRNNRKVMFNVYRSVKKDTFLFYMNEISNYIIMEYFRKNADQFDLDEGEIRILIQYYKCLFMGFLMEWLDNNLKSDFGEEMRQASRLFEKHPELHAVLNRSE